MKIEEEIKTRGFANAIQKAIVNAMFTGSEIRARINRALKAFGLTHEQYNVLRILKGSHPEKMCVKDITCRMIERNSNTTRILDKLVEKKLVTRSSSEGDRREVKVGLKHEGLVLLEKCNRELPFSKFSSDKFSETDAEALSELLDRLREASSKI